MSALADRDMQVLAEMLACSGDTDWLRPMDIGGRDASDESYRMAKLARLGLAERVRRNSIANDFGHGRGSYVYRLTGAGIVMCRNPKVSRA
jgi:predicted transcriptional regulator